MITYEIDGSARLVTCRVTSSLRTLHVANFIERLWQDPDFDRDYGTVVFVDGATVTPDIVARNALAELLLAWRKLHAPAKWAFILPGLAWQRIAVQLIEEYGLAGHNVRCFPNETGVMSWLRTDGAAESTT